MSEFFHQDPHIVLRNEQKCEVGKESLQPGPHQKFMGSVLGRRPSGFIWACSVVFYVTPIKLLYNVSNLQHLLTSDLQFESSVIRPHKPLSGTAKEHHRQETALCRSSPWEQWEQHRQWYVILITLIDRCLECGWVTSTTINFLNLIKSMLNFKKVPCVKTNITIINWHSKLTKLINRICWCYDKNVCVVLKRYLL